MLGAIHAMTAMPVKVDHAPLSERLGKELSALEKRLQEELRAPPPMSATLERIIKMMRPRVLTTAPQNVNSVRHALKEYDLDTHGLITKVKPSWQDPMRYRTLCDSNSHFDALRMYVQGNKDVDAKKDSEGLQTSSSRKGHV
ncbi:MAG: hypothetical protein SGPRY_010498 [Prymnesium sp.]